MKKTNENGFALVMVMLLITILIILGTSFSYNSFHSYKNNVDKEKETKAYYIARSGANIVASALEKSVITSEDIIDKQSSPTTLGDGQFSINVTNSGNNVLIESTGTVNDFDEKIILELKKNMPPLDMAFFATDSINITNGYIYGDMGTNASVAESVSLNSSPVMTGDIYVGPDGDENTIKANETYITYNQKYLNKNREYPLPIFPEFPDDITYTPGTLNISNWDNTEYISDDLYYDKIDIHTPVQVDIGNDDIRIRTKELNINNDITINKTGTGMLKIYVEDIFYLGPNYTIGGNNIEDCQIFIKGNVLSFFGNLAGSIFVENADLSLQSGQIIEGNIISNGNNITIDGDSSAYTKAVYAPDTDITFKADGHVKGAVVCKNMTITGGTVEYDDSIKSLKASDLFLPSDQSFERIWKNN